MSKPLIVPVQDPASLERALQLFQDGKVVAIPTETVYGLAADATNEEAVLKIFAAKKRPADNPLISHVADVAMAERYATLPLVFYKLAEAFWPGPLTMFVRGAHGIASSVIAGTGQASFRMPNQPQVLELIRRLDRPLAAPSANLSGKPSATSAAHVAHDFVAEDVPLILDGGPCTVGLESTILDLKPLEEGKPALLVREGAISLKDLQPFLDVQRVEYFVEGMMVSPGLKYRHYSPQGDLILFEGTPQKMSTDMLQHVEARTVFIGTTEQLPVLEKSGFPVLDGGPYDRPDIAANRLYDLLRQCDTLGARQILCATWPSEEGIGKALRQRQKKAAGLI